MKQLATAMIMYLQYSKGKHPPAAVTPGNVVYPMGWWWETELVKQKYINAPNTLPASGATGKSTFVFSSDSPFRCPSGVEPDDGASASGGEWPTDIRNNGYSIDALPSAAPGNLGIATWYQLNSRTTTASAKSGGSGDTPFLWMNGADPAAIDAVMADPGYQRNMAQIKKASEMIMVVEAGDKNWHDTTTTKTANHPIKAPRIGARHGKRTGDGLDASTNIAFFDGHVASYATLPFSIKGAGAFTGDTIFFLNKQ